MENQRINLGVGCWFKDDIGCDVGDGLTSLFWWDQWLEGEHLKDKL